MTIDIHLTNDEMTNIDKDGFIQLILEDGIIITISKDERRKNERKRYENNM